jgi:hypothetical protein
VASSNRSSSSLNTDSALSWPSLRLAIDLPILISASPAWFHDVQEQDIGYAAALSNPANLPFASALIPTSSSISKKPAQGGLFRNWRWVESVANQSLPDFPVVT